MNKYTEPFTVWKLFKQGCSIIWRWNHVWILTLISSVPACVEIGININKTIVNGTPWLIMSSFIYAEIAIGLSFALFVDRNL